MGLRLLKWFYGGFQFEQKASGWTGLFIGLRATTVLCIGLCDASSGVELWFQVVSWWFLRFV